QPSKSYSSSTSAGSARRPSVTRENAPRPRRTRLAANEKTLFVTPMSPSSPIGPAGSIVLGGERRQAGGGARGPRGGGRRSAAVGDVRSVGRREVRDDEVTGRAVGPADERERCAEGADEARREPEAEAQLARRPCAGAAGDHVLGLDDQLRRDAGTAVADLERGAPACRPRDDHDVTLGGVPDGVVEQRAEETRELVLVGGEDEPGRHVETDHHVLLGRTGPELAPELAEHVGEPDGDDVDRQGAAVEPRHVDERLH